MGQLFADWASGCYVHCGCIGSPAFWFSGGWGGGGGVPVHLFFVVCYCFLFWIGCVLSNSAIMKSDLLCSVVTV